MESCQCCQIRFNHDFHNFFRSLWNNLKLILALRVYYIRCIQFNLLSRMGLLHGLGTFEIFRTRQTIFKKGETSLSKVVLLLFYCCEHYPPLFVDILSVKSKSGSLTDYFRSRHRRGIQKDNVVTPSYWEWKRQQFWKIQNNSLNSCL